MSELLPEIRSRGYWKVIIRPTVFTETRVGHQSALLPILENNAVELKGWSFPHVDSYLKLEKGPDWIGQEISWSPISELWRFYQSGQFVHYFGMPEDWGANANLWFPPDDGLQRVMLDIRPILLQCAEIFEFAARLTFTEAGDEEMHVEVAVDNLQNHFLGIGELGSEKVSRIPEARTTEMQFTADLSRTELVAQTRELSLKPALEIFRCFQWDPGIHIVRDLQDELLRKKPSVAGWI